MTANKSPAIEAWFTALPPKQQIIATSLRKAILKMSPNFSEDIKWKMPNYSLNRLVCYLQKSKTHVTIGFQQGAHLNDPNGSLQGAGKDMRHIKIAMADEIDFEKIIPLIQAAINYDQMNFSK